jgi:hypothetical protein
MNKIKFDPNDSPLWINISMGGKVFIAYTFKLWSADSAEAKKLFEFEGTNQQPQDDHTKLINEFFKDAGGNVIDEPLINYNNRILHVGGTVNATESDSQPYSVILEVYQCSTENDMSNSTRIGQVTGAGNISLSDGSIPIPAVFAQLVTD